MSSLQLVKFLVVYNRKAARRRTRNVQVTTTKWSHTCIGNLKSVRQDSKLPMDGSSRGELPYFGKEIRVVSLTSSGSCAEVRKSASKRHSNLLCWVCTKVATVTLTVAAELLLSPPFNHSRIGFVLVQRLITESHTRSWLRLLRWNHLIPLRP